MNQASLPASLADLLASSPSLNDVLDVAARSALSEAPVLILGEPGTGRSSLARALHGASRRARGPLVELDISAIPCSLFESEIFGRRAGAFTGADASVPGRLELAAGGSLLLDHVEEIPIGEQPKLLRVLAEGRFAPLGGSEEDADIRFLSIGCQDLAERARRGSFRQDLFYRLEVLTLRLPPLRERIGDLESLLNFFLSDLGERFGAAGLRVSDRAWDWMQAYDWPGNVRELRNVLERAMITDDEGVLDPAPPVRRGGAPASLAEVEERQIRRALGFTRGHQGRAAELLGISRKTLWEKRRRYGIP